MLLSDHGEALWDHHQQFAHARQNSERLLELRRAVDALPVPSELTTSAEARVLDARQEEALLDLRYIE